MFGISCYICKNILDLYFVEKYNTKKESDKVMALISCPECNNEVSDKARNCPHCGYGLPILDPGVYCPRCLYSCLKLNKKEDNICQFCHIEMVDSIYGTISEIYDYGKNHPELKLSPEFNEEAYQYRINYVPYEYGSFAGVTCYYCKSANVKKISGVRRFMSTGLFGLGSKVIGKEWHCNNCGSDF